MVDVWTMAMFVIMAMDELSHNTICRPYEIFLWPIIPCIFVIASGFCYGNCMFDKIKNNNNMRLFGIILRIVELILLISISVLIVCVLWTCEDKATLTDCLSESAVGLFGYFP